VDRKEIKEQVIKFAPETKSLILDMDEKGEILNICPTQNWCNKKCFN